MLNNIHNIIINTFEIILYIFNNKRPQITEKDPQLKETINS
jgi:hypothetical protein